MRLKNNKTHIKWSRKKIKNQKYNNEIKKSNNAILLGRGWSGALPKKKTNEHFLPPGDAVLAVQNIRVPAH